MVHQQQFSLRTTGHGDMHDITAQVAAAVAASDIKTGTVNVFNIGSTAAIGTIEFEPGLQQDLPAILEQADPAQPQLRPRAGVARRQRPFAFAGNAAGALTDRAHCRGQLLLGTWQQIFHLECDVRGRQRTVVVTVMGDK